MSLLDKIIKPTFHTYGGENPNEIMVGFCHNCKCFHSLPAKYWVIENGITGTKLVCASSLVDKDRK